MQSSIYFDTQLSVGHLFICHWKHRSLHTKSHTWELHYTLQVNQDKDMMRTIPERVTINTLATGELFKAPATQLSNILPNYLMYRSHQHADAHTHTHAELFVRYPSLPTTFGLLPKAVLCPTETILGTL